LQDALSMMSAFATLSGLYLSTLVGALAVAANASWPLLRDRRRILAVQALASSLFGLHYVLIGARTGAVMCAASMVQSVTAALVSRRCVRLGIVAATLLAAIAMAALTWRGLPSACALTTGLLSASGRLQQDPQRLRRLFVGSALCSMTHNLLVGSPWGLITDTLTLGMLAAGLWRGRARPPSLVAASAPATTSLKALASA
jgi:Bacterial inner membrane protein